jgi:hypothetical protein
LQLIQSFETEKYGHGSCGTQNQEWLTAKGQQQITRPDQDCCHWLVTGYQPVMTGAAEYATSKEIALSEKLLLSNKYLKTQQTGKTWNVL